MTGPRDSPEPGDWLQYAQADLTAAEHMLRTLEPCPFWIVAYHAQQCAEKALKAYLISHGEEHPYTHDLRLLLDSCEQCGADWVNGVRSAEKIMSFSVVERYPSTTRTVTRSEAETAVSLASEVLRVVSDSIEERNV